MQSLDILRRHRFIGVVAGAVVLAAVAASHAQAGVTSAMEPLAASSCSGKNACLQWTNSGKGPGVEGISHHGDGLLGQTNFNSTGPTNGQAGVLGVDNSSAGIYDSGVTGKSIFGTGVNAISVTGAGLNATSTDGIAVDAFSSQGTGIYASTTNPSKTTGTSQAGLSGRDASSDGGQVNVGVSGSSTSGIGVQGISSSFIGVFAQGGGFSNATGYYVPALSISGVTMGIARPGLIAACAAGQPTPCDAFHSVLFLNQSGDIFIKGQIFTGGSCSSGCVARKEAVRFYTPQESLPTVEDFGEAQLVAGRAYVRIDPAFASTMDARGAYMVVITPEGDSHGLYVTAKTQVGFEVRENQGGRSTLAFSYRIVAKPYCQTAQRLQRVAIHTPRG